MDPISFAKSFAEHLLKAFTEFLSGIYGEELCRKAINRSIVIFKSSNCRIRKIRASKRKTAADEDLEVIKKLKSRDILKISANQYGNYEDPYTHLVFNKDERVIGRQEGPVVLDLTPEDLDICRKNNYRYLCGQ
jgi:hypothetical protein